MLLDKMLKLYLEDIQLNLDQYESVSRYHKSLNKAKKGNTKLTNDEKFTRSEMSEIKEINKRLPSVILFSTGMFSKFKKRYKLSYRRINHVSCKTQADLKPNIAKFLSNLFNMREIYKYPPELIINFDETGIFFDTIPSYCYEKRGINRIEVKTSNLQKKGLHWESA